MKLIPASEFTHEQLADLFTSGFEGYVVPVNVDTFTFSKFCALYNINLHRSLVAMMDGNQAGMLLLGSRGKLMRGAAMGIIDEFRNKGIGQALMNKSILDSTEAGFTSMRLEVFETNDPAVNVYKKTGFKTIRKLFGYSKPKQETNGNATGTLEEMDTRDISLVMTEGLNKDYPWHCSPEFFSALGPSSTGYTLDNKAFAIFTKKPENQVYLNAVYVTKSDRKQGWGTKLMSLLFDKFADCTFEIVPVVPEDLMHEFLLSCGFEKSNLNQLEMEIIL